MSNEWRANIEKRLSRIEYIVWYIGGSILIKQGIDVAPALMTLLGLG